MNKHRQDKMRRVLDKGYFWPRITCSELGLGFYRENKE